jgi:ribosomal protein S18 acetylase RimI-like enzyme
MLGWRSEVRVRKGKPADAQALAEVFRLSWQGAYAGIIPHTHLENLIRRRGAPWWASTLRSAETVLVLEFEGKIAGYATLGSARGKTKYQGEIYEIYLSPVYQGLGLGEHLFEACRNRLDQRRLRGLIVWALSDNAQASDFYWRRGGRPVAKVRETIGGAKLEKTAFAWS